MFPRNDGSRSLSTRRTLRIPNEVFRCECAQARRVVRVPFPTTSPSDDLCVSSIGDTYSLKHKAVDGAVWLRNREEDCVWNVCLFGHCLMPEEIGWEAQGCLSGLARRRYIQQQHQINTTCSSRGIAIETRK